MPENESRSERRDAHHGRTPLNGFPGAILARLAGKRRAARRCEDHTMSNLEIPHSSRPSQVDSYLLVIRALLQRDMRTRFGATMWGYLMQVLWPVAHVLIVSSIMAFRHMPSPMGSSILVFVATGAFPALAFQYIAREMMKGVLINKPLTYYPQVRLFDVMLSRAIVEMIGSFVGMGIIFALFICVGQSPLPDDSFTAICGYCAAILLGVGIGTINCAVVTVFPGWMLGFVIVQLALYMTSGIYFLPSFLPDIVYSYMKYNPVLQIIEWVRSGYFRELSVEVDKIYTLLWGLVSLTVGLLLNRRLQR